MVPASRFDLGMWCVPRIDIAGFALGEQTQHSNIVAFPAARLGCSTPCEGQEVPAVDLEIAPLFHGDIGGFDVLQKRFEFTPFESASQQAQDSLAEPGTRQSLSGKGMILNTRAHVGDTKA